MLKADVPWRTFAFRYGSISESSSMNSVFGLNCESARSYT